LMERANKFLAERGLDSPTRPLLLNIAIDIVRDGSLEQDDGLQNLWAKLLVNAADAVP
jgi:hypothetical protein